MSSTGKGKGKTVAKKGKRTRSRASAFGAVSRKTSSKTWKGGKTGSTSELKVLDTNRARMVLEAANEEADIDLTPEQIDELLEITYAVSERVASTGKAGEKFFIFNDPDDVITELEGIRNQRGTSNLISFLNFLRTHTYDEALTLVREAAEERKAFEELTPEFLALLEKSRQRRDIELPNRGQEGIGECLSCGSKKLTVQNVQSRGADEMMSTIYNCSMCNAGIGKLRIYKKKRA